MIRKSPASACFAASSPVLPWPEDGHQVCPALLRLPGTRAAVGAAPDAAQHHRVPAVGLSPVPPPSTLREAGDPSGDTCLPPLLLSGSASHGRSQALRGECVLVWLRSNFRCALLSYDNEALT